MLQKLVNSGNTVVVEHNPDVIKSADWVIDLGPEGGSAGGQIVAEGRPEQVAKVAGSYAGRFLADALMPDADNDGDGPLCCTPIMLILSPPCRKQPAPIPFSDTVH